MMRFLTGFALLAAAGALPAQEGPGGFGRGPEGGRGRMMSPALQAIDTNADGTLSADEIKAAPAALRKLDKNGDGKITEDEVRPDFGGGEGRGRGESDSAGGASPDDLLQSLMVFDKNKDGKLTKDELPERMQGIFTRGDTNKDGILTAAEIRGLATAQAATAPDRGGDGRGGDGRGEGRGRGPGGEGRGGMMRMDPVLAAIDTDHDGTLSATEIRNAPASLLSLDRNNDGQLTEDETRPNFGRGGRGRPDQGPAR